MYSIGSNGNFDYEDGLKRIAPNCEIHTFDFGQYSRRNDGIHYHQWGLSNESSSRPLHRLKTFSQTVRELGHENRRIDLFKMDCEGCEWLTFNDWIRHDIRQINIEVHGLNSVALFDALDDAGFALYSKELNPQWPNGIYELSLIKLAPAYWNERSAAEPGP